MSELIPELAPEVVAACEAGAEEAAGALSRSLDGEFTLTVGEASSYDGSDAPEGFDGPGLAVLMKFGDVGVAALIPESGGILPDWYADPDPTGESKLSTLAQELSMLLVPETLMAEDFQAARVEKLSDALASAEVASDAGLVPLEISSGEDKAQLTVIWPLASPAGLLPEATEEEEAPPSEDSSATPQPNANRFDRQRIEDYSQLPNYTRSLLKVEIPVRVVLASKKEDMKEVVELASGSIIKFEKACDEMLHLYVGDRDVAVGEAVKVGDKFGFRVSSMVLPDELFKKVNSQKAG